MRKPALILLASLFAITSHAQVNWQVRGGYNFNNASVEFNGSKKKTNPKSGFNFGIGAKVFFDYNLYFSPQFNYTMKSYKITYGNDTTIRSSNTTLHYIELPILLQMYVNLNSPYRFFFEYGPSLNFAFSGTENVVLTNGDSEKRKIKFSETTYGRWEASFIVAFGMELPSKLNISADFNLGLTNIANSDFGPTIKTRAFSLNVGYYFK